MVYFNKTEIKEDGVYISFINSNDEIFHPLTKSDSISKVYFHEGKNGCEMFMIDLILSCGFIPIGNHKSVAKYRNALCSPKAEQTIDDFENKKNLYAKAFKKQPNKYTWSEQDIAKNKIDNEKFAELAKLVAEYEN